MFEVSVALATVEFEFTRRYATHVNQAFRPALKEE
jgi:hypothetical protein